MSWRCDPPIPPRPPEELPSARSDSSAYASNLPRGSASCHAVEDVDGPPFFSATRSRSLIPLARLFFLTRSSAPTTALIFISYMWATNALAACFFACTLPLDASLCTVLISVLCRQYHPFAQFILLSLRFLPLPVLGLLDSFM